MSQLVPNCFNSTENPNELMPPMGTVVALCLSRRRCYPFCLERLGRLKTQRLQKQRRVSTVTTAKHVNVCDRRCP